MHPQHLFHALRSFAAEASERAARRRRDAADEGSVRRASRQRGRDRRQEPAAPCEPPQLPGQACPTR